MRKHLVALALLLLSVSSTFSSPAQAAEKNSSTDAVAQQKTVLGKLITELQRSPRSFVYLRTQGFTQTDNEFEQIIKQNGSVFRRTRIVRRDEHGERKIPGWPGIALTSEYKPSEKR